MEEIRDVLMLPRRVKPQPTPNISPGGDCGACVLAGLLGYEVDEIYKIFRDGNTRECLSHTEVRDALYAARRLGRCTDFVDDCPQWNLGIWEQEMQYGAASWMQHDRWFRYLRMGMQAGYYPLCEVSFDRLGPFHTLPYDHWVMLVGARDVWTPVEAVPGVKKGSYQVCVSCSARKTNMELEWVDSRDFLMQRGGFNAILARPSGG